MTLRMIALLISGLALTACMSTANTGNNYRGDAAMMQTAPDHPRGR